MKEISSLTVKYHGRTVGILAETKEGKCAFQYDREWLADGFSLNPFGRSLKNDKAGEPCRKKIPAELACFEGESA